MLSKLLMYYYSEVIVPNTYTTVWFYQRFFRPLVNMHLQKLKKKTPTLYMYIKSIYICVYLKKLTKQIHFLKNLLEW